MSTSGWPVGTNPVSFGQTSGTPIPITERTDIWNFFCNQVRSSTTVMNVIGIPDRIRLCWRSYMTVSTNSGKSRNGKLVSVPHTNITYCI